MFALTQWDAHTSNAIVEGITLSGYAARIIFDPGETHLFLIHLPTSWINILNYYEFNLLYLHLWGLK